MGLQEEDSTESKRGSGLIETTSDILQPIITARYYSLQSQLRDIEPDNPELETISSPQWEPSQENVSQLEAALREAQARTAQNQLGTSPGQCTTTVTVGRYMSPQELAAMRESGRVQESWRGVTGVTYSPSPSVYLAAPEGDVYTEFDIPSSAIGASDGKVGVIYGPNTFQGRYYGVTEMPPATNIRTPLND